MRKLLQVVIGLLLGLSPFALVLLGPAMSASASVGCATIGTTTMTAKVIATSGQDINHQSIDATGCDVGVYVGPGVTGVTIQDNDIAKANMHGIYVQDTSSVLINNNTVTDTVGSESFPELKAIQATGSNGVIILLNTVTNNGSGGIAVTDDASTSPGGPAPGQSRPGNFNLIGQNTVMNNGSDCGVVVSSYNSAGGVMGNNITGNIVTGNAVGIVVAADEPDTTAMNNRITNNVSASNAGPGIIVHSNAPGDKVSNTLVLANRISGNDGIGIMIAAEDPAASLTNTLVIANRISNEPLPIMQKGDTNTRLIANKIS
jgi:parallel beta-helix repeat protein